MCCTDALDLYADSFSLTLDGAKNAAKAGNGAGTPSGVITQKLGISIEEAAQILNLKKDAHNSIVETVS